MHYATFDPVVVSEIALHVLCLGLLALSFHFFKLPLVLDRLQKVLNSGILSLELILVIATCFHNLSHLVLIE